MSEFPVIPGGISCHDVVELLTDYLDGALSAEQKAHVDEHLKLCPPCVDYLDQLRASSRIAAVATAELELRPDRDALLQAFRDLKR